MIRALAALAMVPACGRLGFDPVGGAGTDAGPDAATVCTAEFGAPAQLPGLNTTGSEFSPDLTADQLEVFFHANRTGGAGADDVWTATRLDPAAPFGTATPVTPVNTASNDGAPALSGDDLALYLSSNRPGGEGLYDIHVARRAGPGAPFGAPVREPELSTSGRDFGPWISADGLTALITGEGVSGDLDLYQSIRTDPAAVFPTPVLITELGSAFDENGASMTADGLSIFFSSSRPDGVQTDLWWAVRATVDVPFSTPILVPGVNVPADADFGPKITPDGETLYFTSRRAGGTGQDDLWFTTRDCP